jgi:hypothetical protein
LLLSFSNMNCDTFSNYMFAYNFIS